jgi:hypothetical protein
MPNKKLTTEELINEGKKRWFEVFSWIGAFRGSSEPTTVTSFLYKQVIGTGASYTKKDAASYFSYVIDKLKKLGIDADIVEDEIFGDDGWTLRMPTVAVETARNNINRNHS